MASRASGRGEERSGSRNASGVNENTTRRQGTAAQGTPDNARQNTANRANQSASQRQNATQNQNASQSANRTQSQSRDTQTQQKEATSSAGEAQGRGGDQ